MESFSKDYSTLESVNHDETANALELVKHDRPANAPERAHGAAASVPYLSYDHLQVNLDGSPRSEIKMLMLNKISESAGIEVDHGKHDNNSRRAIYLTEKEGHGDARSSLAASNDRRRKTYWMLAGVALPVMILMALGVGLGVGLHARSVAQYAQSAGSPISAASSVPSHSSALSSASTPIAVPAPLADPAHALLNDTSTAAVTTSNGNRHVFFQESTGIIRESIYSFSIAKWLKDISYVVALDARHYTPMSVFSVQTPTEQIHLFYIDQTDHIIYRILDVKNGIWLTNTSGPYIGRSNLTAAPGSRILSVTPRADPKSTLDFTLSMFYQNKTGSVVWLNGTSEYDFATTIPRWNWMDQGIDGIFDTYANAAIIPGPICTSGYQQTNANRSQAEFTLMGSFPGNSHLAIADLFVGYDKTTNYTSRQCPMFPMPRAFTGSNLTSALLDRKLAPLVYVPRVPPTDCIMGWVGNLSDPTQTPQPYGYVVNDTALTSIYQPDTQLTSAPPGSPFPFARLASTVPPRGTAFYVYHQIDNVTLAEDKYDLSIGHWASTNITISTT